MTTLELTKGQLKYVDHVSHLLMKDCYLSDGMGFEGNVYSSLDWPVDSVTDVLMDEIRRKERCPANRGHWLFWDAVEARTIELLKEQEEDDRCPPELRKEALNYIESFLDAVDSGDAVVLKKEAK